MRGQNATPLKVTIFGTRGSLPISGAQYVRYGGNTTSLRIHSATLPKGTVLAVDAGSGFKALAERAQKEGIEELVLLHTHYHHDHTQGLLISSPLYQQKLPIKIFGPIDKGHGARSVYEKLMTPPLHPVPFDYVASHLDFYDIPAAEDAAIVIHPDAGAELVSKHETGAGSVSIRERRVKLDECLVVTMHPTKHPQHTFAYRFEERPTGRVFVFLTDEEVRERIPVSFVAFLRGAHLLVQDCQYTDEEYQRRTRGFGHGTPAYVVALASQSGVKRVGITHHDPLSDDAEVDALAADARQRAAAKGIDLFACADYLELEV